MTHAVSYDDQRVAKVGLEAINTSLQKGMADFLAKPTVAIFFIIVYPAIGLLMYRFAFDEALLPLLFPIASGFALVGPLAAAGLYEISRRIENGEEVNVVDAFSTMAGDVLVPLVQVGLLLLIIYAAWIGVAQVIYEATLGGYEPANLMALFARVMTTPEGWTLLVVGCGVGFLFALVVLAVGAISLPAIIDRRMGAADAVGLSVRAMVTNPKVMLVWGLVIAVGLVAGSLPFFIGLMVVLPIFGHATWHLYRQLAPVSA
ncbi:MAG: DUF2189 domain-containing protein [Pseudomonadota bacterium]